jgi:small subunit ribosomal protein S7
MEQKKKISLILKSRLGKKFINLVMMDGKKTKAEQIFFTILNLLDKNAADILISSIQNVEPLMEMRSIRVKGRNYQVPVPLLKSRRTSLAIKWVIDSAKKKKNKRLSHKIKDEILLAYQHQGDSIKKKISIHDASLANRAFVHYRWF